MHRARCSSALSSLPYFLVFPPLLRVRTWAHERVEKEIFLLPSLLLSHTHVCARNGEGDISSPLSSLSLARRKPFLSRTSFLFLARWKFYVTRRLLLRALSSPLPLCRYFFSISPLSLSFLPSSTSNSLFFSLSRLLSPYATIDLSLSPKSLSLLPPSSCRNRDREGGR